jgi:MraZ protein
MLTAGLEACVMAYPMREWLVFEEKLMSKSNFDKDLDDVRHHYFGSAEEVEMDSVGRLLIPQSLRKYADLQRDAIWVGIGNHIELWDRARYEAKYPPIHSDAVRLDSIRRRLTEMGM